MAQDEKPDSLDSKVDALAAMAGGQDISHEGFNAIEAAPLPTGESDAAAALVAQATQATQAAGQPAVPSSGTTAVSGARKVRASALQKQRSRVHAEQFKRMMVPILVVTGILLLALGGIMMFMMRQGDAYDYTGAGMLHDPGFKRIMVITSFPLGAILLVGAWLFRMDLKRGEAALRRENEKDKEGEG